MNNPEGTRCDRVGDNPWIATTVARAVGRDRVLALKEGSLKTYFDDLGDCISRNEIPPDDMWDLGEKRFMAGRTIPSTLEEARPQIDALGSAARKPRS